MADKDKKKKSDKKESAKKPVSSIISLGKDLEVDSNKRLEHLDHGEVKAYAAKARRGGVNFYALVCEPHITPRLKAAAVYETISNKETPPLIKRGVVYWPPARAERYVMVFQDTLGQPLLKPDQPLAMGLSNDVVMEKVLRPLVNILLDYRDRDFFHGGIRLSSLFDGGSNSFDNVVLAPSLDGPPSCFQSALYETIYRSMAQPNARGQGRQTHDLYALGVVLAVMLRSTDPLEGLSDKEIIERKLEEGSYSTITGKDRFKGSILELLRGLLHDDDDQRWTIEEIKEWLDGSRLTPRLASSRKKSDRSIAFGGERYFYLPILAMNLDRNTTEAKRIVEEGDLEHWLSRSLGQDTVFESVKDMIERVRLQGQGPGYQDRLVSNLSMVLDPQAPIRYKKLAVFPDGIGTALAEAMVQKTDLSLFADVLGQGLVGSWTVQQHEAGFDSGLLRHDYDLCVKFLRKPGIGLGLERCLYQLNTQTHCLSDKLTGYHVLSGDELLLALDDICKKGATPGLFIDRHIGAFLSMQDARYIDDWSPQINSKQRHVRIVANLRCFATIQRRERVPALPHLGKALASLLPEVYERFHDMRLRASLEKEVTKHANAGDLVKMLEAIDNPAVIQSDFKAFQYAMYEYKKLTAEYDDTSSRMENKAVYGRAAGYKTSAMVSVGLAVIAIAALTFTNFF